MRRFEFTSQDYLRDPVTALERLRAAGPVVEVKFPIIGRTGSLPRTSWPAAS
jgi:cytochrome P450 PksS